MKALVLCDAYPGPECEATNSFVHTQTLALTKLGCEVKVVAPTPWLPRFLQHLWSRFDQPCYEQFDGIEVWRPRFFRPPGAWFRVHAARSAYWCCNGLIKKVIQELEPGLIIAHMAAPAGIVAQHVSVQHQLPYFVTVHGLDITQYPKNSVQLKRQILRALRGARGVVCVSQYLLGVATELGLDRRQLRLGYIGCNAGQFARDTYASTLFRAKHDLAAEDRLIGYIGRMEAEKGVLELVEALKPLLEADPNTKLVLIGDGSKKPAIERRIQAAGLQSKIIVGTTVPPQEVPGILSAFDVLVLPSREEGLGLTTLEAQANGLPVVAFAVGGIREAVATDYGSVLVNPGDMVALCNALATTIAIGREEGADMRRSFVENYFDLQKSTLSLYHYYTQAVEARHNSEFVT